MKALVDYLSGLTLRGGDHDGEPFEVLGWERRFLRGAFGQPDDSAISVGRGNGKSGLLAAVASAVVDPGGPLHGVERHTIVCAASFEQASIIYRDLLGFVGARHDLSDRSAWRKLDSTNRAILEHKPSGALCRCIGSDPDTAHGLRPYLALLDEPAKWPGGSRDLMLAAIRTGLGKTPGSRLIALGTRPSDAAHWFRVMLDGGAGYSQSHHARPGDPPGQRRTWRRANPSLDHFPSLERQIRAEYADAKRNPSLLPMFLALRLNMGTDEAETPHLLEAETWAGIEGTADLSGPMVLGIDTGGSAAMTAAAGYWPRTGALLSVASFARVPSLAERGQRDGVSGLYCEMERRGELLTLGGKANDTAALLRVALERFGRPAVVVADRYKDAELADVLDAERVRCPLVFRGMGMKDGSVDVEAFRRAIAEGRVVPAVSLLLRSAVSEARVLTDQSGNAKLAKSAEAGRRLRARDDAAAAAILAVAEGTRRFGRARPRRRLTAGLAG